MARHSFGIRFAGVIVLITSVVLILAADLKQRPIGAMSRGDERSSGSDCCGTLFADTRLDWTFVLGRSLSIFSVPHPDHTARLFAVAVAP